MHSGRQDFQPRPAGAPGMHRPMGIPPGMPPNNMVQRPPFLGPGGMQRLPPPDQQRFIVPAQQFGQLPNQQAPRAQMRPQMPMTQPPRMDLQRPPLPMRGIPQGIPPPGMQALPGKYQIFDIKNFKCQF